MARPPAAFRQTDVTRAVRAVRAAGLPVSGVKIDVRTGAIEVVTGNDQGQDFAPLDAWMAKHARPPEGH